MNSGVAPLILQKNQYAIGINTSIRGGFIHPRPPIQKKNLIYTDPLLQTIVETGFFQGGGYYRPDYGSESLLAQISGRLIKFTETGSSWTVTDVSIPGDLNSATTSQAWMWQSEKWMIVNDGSGKLPIFFDGTTSRRSLGDSVVIGTLAGTPSPNSVPAINGQVQATLTAPYTGPLGVRVIFNQEYYQIANQSTSTVNAQLKMVIFNPAFCIIPPGVYVSTGDVFNTLPNVIGTFSGVTQDVPSTLYWTFALPSPTAPPLVVGDHFVVPGFGVCVVNQVLSGGLTIKATVGVYSQCLAPAYSHAGTIQSSPQISPVVQVGSITAPGYVNVIYDNGTFQDVVLDTAYTGPDVFVSDNQTGTYFILRQKQTPPSNLIYLTNLTDTATGAYTSGLEILSIPELLPGRMGAYGMGRNWESLTDGISYVAGDIVGGAAGTQAENYRDSVLKMTENTFLAGGGTFRLPGTGDIITAMTFPAMMDTSLGQGALQIFTAFTAFSNNSPPDRSTWAALSYPIQTESLKGNGSLGQNSTIDVNSDTFFRSGIGVGSLVLARRDFVNNSWGNKPISNEMQRILSRDNESLLSYSSAVDCDNRFLITCAPNVSGQGVFHIGLVSLNFDLLSSLRGDLPPSWEGVWTGVNTLQAISGRVNGSIRDFSFTFNMNTNRIELWEFLPEGTDSYQDNDTTPIDWVFESPVLFNKDVKPLAVPIQLNDGEVYLSDIKGKVHVKIQYRPDFYPCWTDWREFDVCAADTVDEKNPQAGYRMRIGLGQPKPDPCEAGNNRPLRNGYFFQFRITVTGYCQWRGMKVSAIQIAEPKFAPVECSIKPCQVIDCAVPDDLRVYSLNGLPPEPLPPVPPPDFKYSNLQITNNYCPGSSVSFTGSLPSWLSIDGENLIVAAGAFKGMTQIGADNSAQAALANFIATNVANGRLICGSPPAPPAIIIQGSCAPIDNGDTYYVFPAIDTSIRLFLDAGSPTISSVTVAGVGFSLVIYDSLGNIVTTPLTFAGGVFYVLHIANPGALATGTLTIVNNTGDSPFVVNLVSF